MPRRPHARRGAGGGGRAARGERGRSLFRRRPLRGLAGQGGWCAGPRSAPRLPRPRGPPSCFSRFRAPARGGWPRAGGSTHLGSHTTLRGSALCPYASWHRNSRDRPDRQKQAGCPPRNTPAQAFTYTEFVERSSPPMAVAPGAWRVVAAPLGLPPLDAGLPIEWLDEAALLPAPGPRTKISWHTIFQFFKPRPNIGRGNRPWRDNMPARKCLGGIPLNIGATRKRCFLY